MSGSASLPGSRAGCIAYESQTFSALYQNFCPDRFSIYAVLSINLGIMAGAILQVP